MNDPSNSSGTATATVDRGVPVIEARGIVKHFGGVVALNGVDVTLGRGEVIGLVGDNGAGKSTLIKILSGALQPTAGEILVDGEPVVMSSPRDAQAAGIQTVYQDLALFDDLSVAANMFAGREVRTSLGLLNHRHMRRFTKEVVKKLNVDLPNPDSSVRNLSGGQRQAVAVARSVAFGSRVVILDEPTSALSASAAETVLEVVRDLRNHGVSVIFIAHNMDHVLSVCDRIYVLRRGDVADVLKASGTSTLEIVTIMLGGTSNNDEEAPREGGNDEAG